MPDPPTSHRFAYGNRVSTSDHNVAMPEVTACPFGNAFASGFVKEKMKSRLRNIIHLVAHVPHGLCSILTVSALALVAASLPAHAQETWQVDPQFSISRSLLA
jgi:hypothetical protein